MSPYRLAPVRGPRPVKRSALRRIWAAARRRYTVTFAIQDALGPRPAFLVLQAIAALVLYGVGWYVASTLAWASVALLNRPVFDVLRVLRRLLVARRTMRRWTWRSAPPQGPCSTCGADFGEPCDQDTHALAGSHSMTDWEVAAIRRDDRFATRHARTAGVSTTFPRIAAYRVAARTGDWSPFEGRDLSPVTESLRGLDERVPRDGKGPIR